MPGKLRPSLLNQILEGINIMERQPHPAMGKAKRDGIRELVNREKLRATIPRIKADRFHAMSDEDLAKALHEIFCDGMIYGLQSTAGDWHGAKKESDFLSLLRQPINEEEENR